MHPQFPEPLYLRTLILDNIKPFSINSWFYGQRKIKTQAAWDWTDSVFMQLDRPQNQRHLEVLRDAFDPSKHTLGAIFKAYYPREVFYNKQGQISAKTIDCSNFEKPLLDCIVLKKFHDETVPRGCKNLNTDDRYVTMLQSSKEVVDGPPRIEATILILPKPS